MDVPKLNGKYKTFYRAGKDGKPYPGKMKGYGDSATTRNETAYFAWEMGKDGRLVTDKWGRPF